MQKSFPKYLLSVSVLLLVLSLISFSAQPVLAKGRPDGLGQSVAMHEQVSSSGALPHNPHSSSTNDADATTSAGLGHGHMPGFVQQRLQAGKLQSCQAHANNIKTRSDHMNTLALNMEKTFDAIAQGMENHYTNQLVPQGKTVANYATLVADIQTKKDALVPLLTAIQTDITNFSCDGNNPGAQLTQYRTDMQAVIKGLQAYRTSVRSLIVAIASVQGVTERNGHTLSPTVSPTQSTETPTASPTLSVSPSVTTP